MHTSGVSDEFGELPTTSECSQKLVNQSDEFAEPLQAISSFLQGSKRKCPLFYPKDNLEEETEQLYEVPQDRFICLPS